MASLLQDLRYAARTLRKSPGFALITILTLALGMGVNSAIFSVVNAVLLKPLPYGSPDRLMQLLRVYDDGHLEVAVSAPNFEDWRAQSRSFEAMAATDYLPGGLNLTGNGEPERFPSIKVTADYFRVLGTAPALGRDFRPEEDRPGTARVAVLTDGLWRKRFGADPSIIGRALVLSGEPYTVVGVLPPGFADTVNVDLYTPLVLAETARDRGANSLRALARLKPGVSLDQARLELKTIGAQLEQAHAAEKISCTATVLPLQQRLAEDIRPALLLLLGAVSLVLLIACANVANLLLSRGTGRGREIAVRAALGASRRRLIQQLLTESVLLALCGGLLGLLLSHWLLDTLVALAPEALPRLTRIEVDGTVLLFSFTLAAVTGLLFGLVPALQGSRTDLQGVLRQGSKGTASGAGRRAQGRLVVAELAFTFMLLVGAGLLISSFLRLREVDPGFNPTGALTLQLSLPESRYGETRTLAPFLDQAMQRIGALPGVTSAAAVINLPTEPGPDLTFEIEGRPVTGDAEVPGAQYRPVTPGYFAAMGIELKRGRLLGPEDTTAGPGVVVINEALARRFFPGEDALGKRMTPGLPNLPQLADPSPRTIIGIVADVHEQGLERRAPPTMYLPYAQLPDAVTKLLVTLLPTTFVVRTAGPPGGYERSIREALWSVDPQQPVARVMPLEQVVAASLAPQQFNAMLLGVFAAVSLLLASVGVYGVISYNVSQRTHEIGIRVALGAKRADVVRMVVGHAMRLVAIGLGLGLVGALLVTRLFSSLLYGVSPTDPATFIALSAVLAGVALLASYLPARRALRVDPMSVLRAE